jgi:hypothetical protein
MDRFDLSLFDLKKDPHELRNVIDDNPKAAETLKSHLDDWEKSQVKYQEEESEFAVGMDEGTKKRIKDTGYWQ